MASKSRLGKGLGALFPTLPGEEPVAEQPAMIAEDSSTPEATADITPAKKATAQQESKPAVPQTISSSKAVKKAAGKRASMPALDTITHPSDLFFGTEKPQTGKVAAPQQGGKSSASQTAHRTSVTVKDVSRETSLTASAAKTADTDKKDELKPVAGGYLAELKLSDIGPNAHQPRTIFDEDELNELSASIKEVGVLQPIVVRKRPASQIAAAKAAYCDEFVREMPDGYQTVLGENGSTLSGGERQRISIARALLKNAPIILLDEATASLDPENEVLVQKAIAKLVEGKTVIMIAHRLRTVVDADQILVLDNGRLVEHGTHDELMKKNGLYHKLFHIQQESLGWAV